MDIGPQNSTTKQPPNLLPEGIAVVLLTVAAYAVAFSYEAGFCCYFRIPYELISTSASILLKAAAAVLVGIAIFFGIAITIWQFVPRSDTVLAQSVNKFIAVALMIGLALSPFLLRGEGWVHFFIMVGIIGFFEFIFPLLTQWKQLGFTAKIEAQAKLEQETFPHTLVGILTRFGTREQIYLLMVVALVAIFAFGQGTQDAKLKTNHLLFDGKDDEVVLAIYGDVFVSSKFDRKSHILNGVLKVQKLGDGKSFTLQRVSLGSLKPSVRLAYVEHMAVPSKQPYHPNQAINADTAR